MSNVRQTALYVSADAPVVEIYATSYFTITSNVIGVASVETVVEATTRSAGDDWKWTGVPSQPIELIKPPITRVEPRILTVLQFYTYTTTTFALDVRAQEQLPFASHDHSDIAYQYRSLSFAGKKLRDHLSYATGEIGHHTNTPFFHYDHISAIGYNHQEQIALHHRWVDTYREGIVKPNLPLSLLVNLRERHEYETKLTVPLPWHVRTPILEYVRWHTPLTVSLPDNMDDETLLAALAHLIIEIEEKQ